MAGDGLDRFLTAQHDPAAGIDVALSELASGHKRSHWVWYIFPQLAGLGSSPMAELYGIHGIDEASAYLRHPVLATRLAAAASAVARQLHSDPPPSIVTIMGSPIDARKLVSSMTLFGELARRLNQSEPTEMWRQLTAAADTILAAARREGMRPCDASERALRTSGTNLRG